MYGQVLCLAVSVLGVDVGWQSLPDGGVQYLIQIRPSLVEAMQSGQALESEVPPQLRSEIRSYRITVGSKRLPQYPSLEALAKPKTVEPVVKESSKFHWHKEVASPEPRKEESGSTPDFGFGPYRQQGNRYGAPTTPTPATNNGVDPFARPNPGRSDVPGPPRWPWETSTSGTSAQPTSPSPLPGEHRGKSYSAQPISFADNATNPPADQKASPAPAPAEHQWMWGTWLAVALVALAGSVSWNVYLIMLLQEARRRYRSLLQRSGLAQDELQEEEGDQEEKE
jgi:hypothetical protein